MTDIDVMPLLPTCQDCRHTLNVSTSDKAATTDVYCPRCGAKYRVYGYAAGGQPNSQTPGHE